jgi:predicted ATPase
VTILRGAAIGKQRGFEEGIGQMLAGLAANHAMGADMARSNGLMWLAEVYGDAGRFDDGLMALAEAEIVANENEDRQHEADRYRIKGELLLRQNRSRRVEAEHCFRRAIANARNQNAKILELRATVSLSRLLVQQGRRDEARKVLAEIYNWFTEGFDTADLKAAKILLDELGN